MRDSLCDMWEAITAGHVQRGPSLLVPLVNICSVMDQQLDALQVPRQDGLMDGSHTYIQTQKTLLHHSDAGGLTSEAARRRPLPSPER